MTNREIIDGLIARDDEVTKHFFFKKCRPLFISIIRFVFDYEVDYDEFVNELYLYLMENDAHRLRLYEGRSSIYMWLKVVATRFFIAKRNNLVNTEAQSTYDEQRAPEGECSNVTPASQADMERLLAKLPNRRYAYVIRRLVFQDAEPKSVAEELRVSVDNLYNIKKRAIDALTAIALNDKRIYEKGRSR